MPKVSVVVPVYNVEKYIEKCLNSLNNQTLQDIEFIIVNDGSTDGSEQIIKKFLENDSNKFKYVTKENGGLSDARNFGLQYATGDYIAFLDSDDYVDSTIYEKMYNKAQEEQCDFVECDFIWKYDNKEVKDCGEVYNDKHEMIQKARVVAWNKLIKRDLLLKANATFPKGLRYEDIEFFFELIPYINKVGFVKEFLIYYVQRNSSIANTQDKRNSEIFEIMNNVINYYKSNGLYEEYKIDLEYFFTRILLCSSFFRIVKIKDKNIRKELLNLTWDKLNYTFPNWKCNCVLQNNNTLKNKYIKTINKCTFNIYAVLFRFKF